MTTLRQLEDAHDTEAAAKVTKTLNNIKWRINPNDILWAFHLPQVDKQLGRSKRVFDRLTALNKIFELALRCFNICHMRRVISINVFKTLYRCLCFWFHNQNDVRVFLLDDVVPVRAKLSCVLR